MKVKNFSIKPLPFTVKYTREVLLKSFASLSSTVYQSLTERWPGERKEKIRETI